MVIERNHFRIAAAAVPVVEGGGHDRMVGQRAPVGGSHHDKGIAPEGSAVVLRRLDKNSGTGIAEESHAAPQLAETGKNSGLGEFPGFGPGFSAVG